MEFVRVYSEWDLGVPEFYEDMDLARESVRNGLSECGIDETLEELEDEGLISYEYESVLMRPE